MFTELELFLCLALSAKFHNSDTAILETINRLEERELIDTTTNTVVALIRSNNSPLNIVKIALKHYEPHEYV